MVMAPWKTAEMQSRFYNFLIYPKHAGTNFLSALHINLPQVACSTGSVDASANACQNSL